MADRDNITPDDIGKAAAIAEDIRQEDIERKSAAAAAEEVGIPSEYVAKAAAQLQQDKVERQRVAKKRRDAVVITACVVIIAVFVNITAHKALNLDAVTTPRPYIVPALPKKLDKISDAKILPPEISVNAIPIDANAPIVLKAQSTSKYPTSISFENDLGRPVKVYEMSTDGTPQLRTDLSPAGKHAFSTNFGTPWLVTDEKNKNVGVFFPTARPETATIPTPEILASLGQELPVRRPIDYPYYLKPLYSSDKPTTNASDIKSAIEFANLTGSQVDVYKLGADGTNLLATTVDPGANYVCASTVNERWLVTDQQSNTLGRYATAAAPMTAIIWPE